MTDKTLMTAWQCNISAMHDVKLADIGGILSCISTGRDPQLKISTTSPDGKESGLPRGDYDLVMAGTVEGGILCRPYLYLDFGDGFRESQGQKIPLGQLSATSWGCRISLPRDVLQLRLDPSEEIVQLSMLSVTINVIQIHRSKVAARVARNAYHMLPRKVRQALIQHKIPHWFLNRFEPQRSASGPLGDAAIEGVGNASDPGNYVAQGNHDWASGLVGDYTSRMFVAKGGRGGDYAAIASEPVRRVDNSVKAIAYYLPQMHPFKENDAWWGRGFTEWTNVSKAVAQFDGHYQPKLPGELGFYDLRLPEVMARQIELAKLYGLQGFCFYYYWFHGKRLLEKPLDMFLNNKSEAFNFDFCLCWANENWTRRWDGAENEVLMGQEHSAEDHIAVFQDLARYFDDDRYIKVDGRPVILIYRPSIIPDVAGMLRLWRKAAADRGMKGLYVVATNSFGFDDAEAEGFDAICGFPPHGVQAPAVNQMFNLINSEYSGYIFRYEDVVASEKERLADQLERAMARADGGAKSTRFPGVMVAWDNEARKPGRGNVFHASTPVLYRDWLSAAVDYTMKVNKNDRQFVFINAWNEWAEGAYLEPDRKYGYAYLAATASVINDVRSERARLLELAQNYNAKQVRSSENAICAHLFYPGMIEEFSKWFKAAGLQLPLDIILTVPDTWSVENFEKAITEIAPTHVIPMKNQGRDVAPFLEALRKGLEMGYRSGCKVHSKKSPQRTDGDEWRQRLFAGLLDQQVLDRIEADFLDDEEIAIAAPSSEFVTTDNVFSIRDNLANASAIMYQLGASRFVLDEFVAGTMFWFKFEALRALAESSYRIDDFGPELGQIDGTLAHAFERIFVPLVKANGYQVLRYHRDGTALAGNTNPAKGMDA